MTNIRLDEKCVMWCTNCGYDQSSSNLGAFVLRPVGIFCPSCETIDRVTVEYAVPSFATKGSK